MFVLVISGFQLITTNPDNHASLLYLTKYIYTYRLRSHLSIFPLPLAFFSGNNNIMTSAAAMLEVFSVQAASHIRRNALLCKAGLKMRRIFRLQCVCTRKLRDLLECRESASKNIPCNSCFWFLKVIFIGPEAPMNLSDVILPGVGDESTKNVLWPFSKAANS